MSITQRILDYLNQHSEGADDDELAAALGLPQRQTANIVCRRLAEQHLIERRKENGKIRNFATGQPMPEAAPVDTSERLWYWEGHVQDRVVQYLREQGYTILHTANTATHEPGKDIEVKKDGRLLWVTVKGYPQKTERTNATVQAAHWFKDAFFDIVVWRGVDPQADLALAFPDFPRYRKLLERVAWLLPIVKCGVFWVREYGTVRDDT